MDPKKLFFDDRLSRCCTYCGRESATRDHVPSKVLLDKPYPPQLPVVGACLRCNGGFSLDEEYLACLLECVVVGSASPEAVERPKVKRLLAEKPALAQLIADSQSIDSEGVVTWKPILSRVENVLLKLATGHATYESAEFYGHDPSSITFAPVPLVPESERRTFETPVPFDLWPEIGTRAFVRMVHADADRTGSDSWQVVQEGRYRYLTSFGSAVAVRMVLSEYLLGEVIWNPALHGTAGAGGELENVRRT